MRQATSITLTSDERNELEAIARSQTAERRLVERAQVVMLASEGMGSNEIARRLGVSKDMVCKVAGSLRKRSCYRTRRSAPPRPASHLRS